jgi:type VI secretion system protein ImpL
MFAPGSGLMDSFFQQNLVSKVDTSGAHWRFNPGVDGRTVPGGEGVLRPFQQAQNIRDTFFSRDGKQTPSFDVTLKPVSMDSDILSMVLDIDGQTLQYSHGPLVPQVVTWPGSKHGMRVGLQLNLFNGSSASLWTSGDWALHRLLDKATIADGATARSRLATFNIDGHRVTLEIISNSVRDPFVPPPFTCS